MTTIDELGRRAAAAVRTEAHRMSVEELGSGAQDAPSTMRVRVAHRRHRHIALAAAIVVAVAGIAFARGTSSSTSRLAPATETENIEPPRTTTAVVPPTSVDEVTETTNTASPPSTLEVIALPEPPSCTARAVAADLGVDPEVLNLNACSQGWVVGNFGFSCVPADEGECEIAGFARWIDGHWTFLGTGYPFCAEQMPYGMPLTVGRLLSPICATVLADRTPEPSTGPIPMGVNGPRVRALQQALRDRGHDVAIDGVFGDGTVAAVCAFQQDNGLACDGNATPAVLDLLGLPSVDVPGSPCPDDRRTDTQLPLKHCSFGYGVIWVRDALAADGDPAADSDEVAGDVEVLRFTDEVAEAVRRFQRRHGLDADGLVGPLTWFTMYPAYADASGDLAAYDLDNSGRIEPLEVDGMADANSECDAPTSPGCHATTPQQ